MRYSVNDVVRTKQGIEYIISRINKKGYFELIPIQEEYLRYLESSYNDYLKDNKYLKNKMLWIEFIRIEVEEEWFNQRKCKRIA